jgi:hypothetical protein
MRTKFWLERNVGKSPLGRPKSRWEDIRMDLAEIGWEGDNWMDLALNREH